MIFSLNHLNTFLPKIKLDSSIEKVINNIGFEVESINKFSDVKGIKFAHVKKIYKNPNSDNLFVAELKLFDQNLTIQTTDDVLQAGDLVVCFPVGSSKGEMIFGEKKLKGILSQGMMASFSELGYKQEFLGKEIEHLIRLPKNFADLSEDPMKVLGVDDYLIDITMTSNRNDANCYHILAKELAAYYGTELYFENSEVKNNYDTKIAVSKGISEELCIFEAKRKKNIQTPLYEKLLLSKHEVIVNEDWIVNLTNLCLITTGAPAHVYNKKQIGKQLSTSLYSGTVKILGNKEINLSNALVVNDENGPISIASVMGLEASKATLDSKELVFEIGNFSSKLVRDAAIQIKMSTASSTQASKTITKACLVSGINYLRNYLAKNNLDVSNIVGIPQNLLSKTIKFDKEKLLRYANLSSLNKVFDSAITKLKKLDFVFVNDEIKIPQYRYDIDLFEDIIEEIFRFYSYDNFQPVQPHSKSFKVKSHNNLQLAASYLGYTEVRTYSLTSKDKNFLNPFNFEKKINLQTYVSKEREQIRDSIVPSFLEVITYNKKREMNNINIFEKGMINNNIYVYGFASTTKTFSDFKKDIIDFYKSDNLEFKKFSDNKFIHPNYSAKIYENGLFIGWMGKMHPAYDSSVALVAEILVPSKNKPVKFNEIDYSPLKNIDLTFSLELRDNVGDLISKIKEKYSLYAIYLKDTFVKDSKKNVTFRITSDSETIKNINEEYNK